MIFKAHIKKIYSRFNNIIFNQKKFDNVKIMKDTIIDSQTQIGEYTYVGQGVKITKSTIGRYCSIAPDVSIGLGEHDFKRISTSTYFYKDNTYEQLTKDPVFIGNDVWIGTKSTILRGVTIGNGAVIGANSVVTHNVPEFAIVAGVPARIIKYRHTEDIINLINKSKWWEFDLESADKLIMKLTNIML